MTAATISTTIVSQIATTPCPPKGPRADGHHAQAGEIVEPL